MKTAKYICLIVWVVFHGWFMITVTSAMSRWFLLVGCIFLCCVIVLVALRSFGSHGVRFNFFLVRVALGYRVNP